MLKMTKESELFLRRNLPAALDADTLNAALDALYDLIEDRGFAPPEYEWYNDFGKEAQQVYDDLYYSNTDQGGV